MCSEISIEFSFVDSSARLKILSAFSRLGTVGSIMVPGRVVKCNYFLFSLFLNPTTFF